MAKQQSTDPSAPNTLCVIPARMGSSRYPGKPLTPILEMPMLGHVAKRCQLAKVFSRVVVATCDQEIVDYCRNIDVESVMTSGRHERASDRVQEATETLERSANMRFASVTMVQGDEPMVTPLMLRLALQGLAQGVAPVVNLKSPISSAEEFNSPNCVKVVTDEKGFALYFSRAPIPSEAKAKTPVKALKQVCIIPFERSFLDTYSNLQPTYLEEIESVDMLRVLEHGYKLLCIDSAEESYPVDVPEDVQRVEAHLRNCPLLKQYKQ